MIDLFRSTDIRRPEYQWPPFAPWERVYLEHQAKDHPDGRERGDAGQIHLRRSPQQLRLASRVLSR